MDLTTPTPPNTENRGMDLDELTGEERRKIALIIDDEPESNTLLKMILRKSGLDVMGALNGPEALAKCTAQAPDIIFLDLMMPEMDGWELYEHLRKITDAPVIIVSAKTAKDDVVRGLQIGAEDYITKPYHPAELVARVNRVLNRNKSAEKTNVLYFSEVDLLINFDTREVTLKGKLHDIPTKAFEVLSVLAKQAPRTVGNEAIAIQIWGEDSPKIQNRIKHLIFLLRKNLEDDPNNPILIKNRGGIGYRLVTQKLS
jgi:DNA-binding response OmpR family regulator